MRLTGGEAFVEILKRYGVTHMFGLPGDQTHIYDALFRNSKIRHILVRHEQAAAHMADGYARVTGRVGVCDATVGPGATNLISGIAEAYTSAIPVIAVASDIRSDWRGRGSLQEIDQLDVFKPITKAAVRVDVLSRVPEMVRRAFEIATSGKPGPVFLNVPLDVLKGEAEFSETDFAVDERRAYYPALRYAPPASEIEQVVELLLHAQRPTLVCGGGVISSGAWPEIQLLVERLGVPVVTTFMGKGSIAETHPLCLGPFGLLGRPAANDWVLQSDFILAIGTRFTNVDTAAWRIPKPETDIVQIDIEPEEIGKNYRVRLGIVGDARTSLRSILDALDAREPLKTRYVARSTIEGIPIEWRKRRGIDSKPAADMASSPVHPLQVIRALRQQMRADDVIVCDSGFNQIWGGQYFEVQVPGRSYMGPRGFGVMGFSFPAAIAGKLATPERRFVALCGDGGFSMVLQELETARRVQAPVVVCVMNNSNLEYVKANQRLVYDSRFISSDYLDLNFAEIARAFGCHGIRVERSGELGGALQEALSSQVVTVVDVHTVESAEPDRMSLQKLGQ